MRMGTTTNSESLFDRLPGDVIQMILRDLPVKTLLRCIRVSKSFASIISSSSFIYSLPCTAAPSSLVPSGPNDASLVFVHCYQRTAPTKKKYLQIDCEISSGSSGCKDYSCTSSAFGLNVAGVPKLKVAGACKGLICLRELSNNRVLLWNPLIERFFVLPEPGFDIPCVRYLTRIGLGFDSKDNDYKVLMVPYSTMPYSRGKAHRDGRELYLYSLKSNSWKAIGSSLESLPTTNRFMTNPLVFAGGSLHFLEGSEFSSTIVAFDMGDRILRRISTPVDARCAVRHLSISEYDGGSSIALMATVAELPWRDIYKLWVMKEYGVEESWVKLTLGDFIHLTRIPWFQLSDYISTTNLCSFGWEKRQNNGYQYAASTVDSLALLDKRRKITDLPF